MNIRLSSENINDGLIEFTLTIIGEGNYRASIAFDNTMSIAFLSLKPTQAMFKDVTELHRYRYMQMELTKELIKYTEIINSNKGTHLLTESEVKQLFGLSDNIL